MAPLTDASPPDFNPAFDPISARYLWGAEEMAEALSAHNRHMVRPVFRFLLYLILGFYPLVSLVVPVVMACNPENSPETRRNAALIAILAGLFWSWVVVGIRRKSFLRWRTRRIFRSNPNGAGIAEWSFGPEEVAVRTPLTASTILWPAFIKVVEAPRGFMLYQNSQLFNWVPGHAFRSAGELARFIALARTHVADYRVLRECRFVGKPEASVLD